MGDVYRATDPMLGRDVALKVLTPALHRDLDFRRRLEEEAHAASSLNHPNIVTAYEIGPSGRIDFVASELVDGMTVRARLAVTGESCDRAGAGVRSVPRATCVVAVSSAVSGWRIQRRGVPAPGQVRWTDSPASEYPALSDAATVE